MFTKYNEAALIIYKYLVKEYSKNSQYPARPILVYGGMPKNERQKAANEFQNGEHVNIIIGISEALGTGFTLTRAQLMILVDQEGDPGIHEQKIGRVLRQTNYNWLGLNIYELFSDNISWEQSVAPRRQGREHFANAIDEQAFQKMAKSDDDQEQRDQNDESDDEDTDLDNE